VLLGLLMRNNTTNTNALLVVLPGSSRRVKLDALVNHAREFSGLYADFVGRVSRGESAEDEEESNGVHRRAGVDVTQDVIRSLETLRDGR